MRLEVREHLAKCNLSNVELDLLSSLVDELGSSPVGKRCRDECMKQIERVLASARELIHVQFGNIFSCSTASPTVMTRYAELSFFNSTSLEKAQSVLRALPGQDLMSKELVMLQYVVKLLKEVSAIAIDRLEHTSRQERKMSATRVSQLSAARLTLSMTMAFYDGVGEQKDHLFTDRAKMFVGALCKHGEVFKADSLPATFNWITKFLKEVIDSYVDDTQLLSDMVDKMLVPIPKEVKSSILAARHSVLRAEMLKNPQYKPTINGTNLLAQWRQWLKKLNGDGGALVPSLGFRLGKISETIVASRDLTIITEALNTVTKTLPEIFNVHQRKAAALAYLNKQTSRQDFDAGTPVISALKNLSEGKPVESEEAAAAPAAEAAATAPAAEATTTPAVAC